MSLFSGTFISSKATLIANSTITLNQGIGGAGHNTLFFPDTFRSGGYGIGGVAARNSSTNNLLVSTILAGNIGGQPSFETTNVMPVPNDGAGVFYSLGNNLFGNTNSPAQFYITNALYLHATDRVGVDPFLGPLQDNGGRVPSHALLMGSPAIDAGKTLGLLTDSRGEPRTIDDPDVANGPGSDGSDIGAFEVNPNLIARDIRRIGTNVEVRFTTVSDRHYSVEYRAQMTGQPWIELPGVVHGTGGIVTYTDTNAAILLHRFYRLRARDR